MNKIFSGVLSAMKTIKGSDEMIGVGLGLLVVALAEWSGKHSKSMAFWLRPEQ